MTSGRARGHACAVGGLPAGPPREQSSSGAAVAPRGLQPGEGTTPAPRSDPQPIAGAQAGAIQEGSLEMAFGDQTLRTSAPGDEAASHRVRPWMNSGDFVTGPRREICRSHLLQVSTAGKGEWGPARLVALERLCSVAGPTAVLETRIKFLTELEVLG